MNFVLGVDLGYIDYHQAWTLQKELHTLRCQNKVPDLFLLCEHPHTFTVGRTGSHQNLLISPEQIQHDGVALVDIDRGGDITYHGPGQVVGYPILDLHNYYLDVHRYLRDLEDVLIRVLDDYDISAERIDGLTGVWVDERKIAAMGIKVKKWVTMHGFAFNLQPDLTFFDKIIPCGIRDKAVTSLYELYQQEVDRMSIINRIWIHFKHVFNVRVETMSSVDFFNRFKSLFDHAYQE